MRQDIPGAFFRRIIAITFVSIFKSDAGINGEIAIISSVHNSMVLWREIFFMRFSFRVSSQYNGGLLGLKFEFARHFTNTGLILRL